MCEWRGSMGHADFLEHGQMDQIIHKANNKTKERDNGLLLLYTQSYSILSLLNHYGLPLDPHILSHQQKEQKFSAFYCALKIYMDPEQLN